MAHYAYLDNDNKVVAVTVGKDEIELINGLDTETYYAQGTPYVVKRTSYNAATNRFRFNYAGVGYTYDELRDGFIPPKCHDEAIVNDKCLWDCTNTDHDVRPDES